MFYRKVREITPIIKAGESYKFDLTEDTDGNDIFKSMTFEAIVIASSKRSAWIFSLFSRESKIDEFENEDYSLAYLYRSNGASLELFQERQRIAYLDEDAPANETAGKIHGEIKLEEGADNSQFIIDFYF